MILSLISTAFDEIGIIKLQPGNIDGNRKGGFPFIKHIAQASSEPLRNILIGLCIAKITFKNEDEPIWRNNCAI